MPTGSLTAEYCKASAAYDRNVLDLIQEIGSRVNSQNLADQCMNQKVRIQRVLAQKDVVLKDSKKIRCR